mgnify:CR=1 FL=1
MSANFHPLVYFIDYLFGMIMWTLIGRVAMNIFQKEDLTLQKHSTYIVFKDSHQSQRVNYSDVTFPSANNIDSLMDLLIGYIDSKDTTADSIDYGNERLNSSLKGIYDKLNNIEYILKSIAE